MSQVLSPALARAAEALARRNLGHASSDVSDSASRVPKPSDTYEPHCVMTWATQVAAMDEMVGGEA